MKKSRIFLSTLIGILSIAGLSSCSDDAQSSGTANVKVTDAMVDVQNVNGVYLKVNEIQAKGTGDVKVIAMFDSTRTFNVMDYTEGETFDLGNGELAAGIYSELRLILEEGSYVSFKDGTSEPLTVPSGTSSGYKIKGDFQISANNETDLVIDIDLRKAFVVTGNGEYKLRPTARLMESHLTSVIYGTVSANDEDRLVIYAYAKGTYEDSEANEPAAEESRFEGSINSAVVTNGEFTLAFMQPGTYDLVVARYTEDLVTGTYTFKSAAIAEVMVNGTLLDILELEANTDREVLVMVGI